MCEGQADMRNAVTIVPPHPHLLVRPSRRAGSLRPLALRASWTLRLQEMCATAAAGLVQAEDAIELCTVCKFVLGTRIRVTRLQL